MQKEDLLPKFMAVQSILINSLNIKNYGTSRKSGDQHCCMSADVVRWLPMDELPSGPRLHLSNNAL